MLSTTCIILWLTRCYFSYLLSNYLRYIVIQQSLHCQVKCNLPSKTTSKEHQCRQWCGQRRIFPTALAICGYHCQRCYLWENITESSHWHFRRFCAAGTNGDRYRSWHITFLIVLCKLTSPIRHYVTKLFDKRSMEYLNQHVSDLPTLREASCRIAAGQGVFSRKILTCSAATARCRNHR